MKNFKPMLACSTIPNMCDIKYPVLASPKLDGIRCLIVDGKPVSRSLKPIPNKFINETLTDLDLPALDGELMLEEGDFNCVQSAVMSEYGKPNFKYVVFDCFNNPTLGYQHRLKDEFFDWVEYCPYVHVVNQTRIANSTELGALYNEHLGAGYEGTIVRSLDAPYKCGRSTLNQGWMLKLKSFSDAEATIVELEELMHNDNKATIDNLGHTVRSAHQAGQIPGNTLGALVVEFNGKQFKIGTGFNAAERSKLWHLKDKLIGKLVTFKYQELSKYGIPRFPVYKGVRNKEDMS